LIYLVLSILISSSLFIIFKCFDKYNVNTFQAIIVNYIVACICGFLSFGTIVSITEIAAKPWIIGAMFLGILFIAIFLIMALTSQRNGISVASVASKMSVVIPVIFAVIVYKEQLGFLKVIGIVLALLAVYLTSLKESGVSLNKKNLLYPFLLFLGSGVIDTTIKYIETTYVAAGEIPLFSAVIFGCAAIIGCIIISIKKDFNITGKTILGGIALGIPNYYSIYFLLKALQNENFESSTIFTINNVAIVMCSTIFGIILFNEKLSNKNKIGIAIAITSIILVAMS